MLSFRSFLFFKLNKTRILSQYLYFLFFLSLCHTYSSIPFHLSTFKFI